MDLEDLKKQLENKSNLIYPESDYTKRQRAVVVPPADACGLNIPHVNISNSCNEITAKVMADLQKQRETAIFDRLTKLGIEIDIEVEKRRRFKSLTIEHRNNEETIYYNDGSEAGLRVITFVTKQIPFDVNKMSMGFETSYY